MTKVKAQYTVLAGDVSGKLGKNQAGDLDVSDYGIIFTNSRGEILVDCAEGNNLRITNAFFGKRLNRKWTRRSPNGESKYGMDFILRANSGIVHDVEMFGKA